MGSSSRSPLTSADSLFPPSFALLTGRHSAPSIPQTDADKNDPIDDTFHTFLVRAANPHMPIATSADSGGAHAIAMRWPASLRSNSTQTQTSTSKAVRIGRGVLCCHPALLRQYVVLDKRAVPVAMYCPVAGAGDAAILAHLMSTASSSLSKKDIMPKSRVHTVVPMHALALRDRERMLLASSDKLLRFTFVRHPFTRALAVYRLSSAELPFETNAPRNGTTGRRQVKSVTKMIGDDELRRERAQRLVNRLRNFSAMSRVRASPLSFRLFLSLLTTHVRVKAYFKEQQQQQRSSHSSHQFDDDDGEDMELIKSQADMCAVDTFNYSFVGRVERFHHDLNTINEWLGIRRTVLPIHHSSGARQAANDVFADHRTRQKAARLFRRDMHAFGFSLSEY